VRPQRLLVESHLSIPDFISALRQSAAMYTRDSRTGWGIGGTTFNVAADGQTVSIVVIPSARRFVPQLAGAVSESEGGSSFDAALGPRLLERIIWRFFLAGALWVIVGSLIYGRFHGEGWAISLASATAMGVLTTPVLAVAYWVLWGSTQRDREVIRAILAAGGQVRDQAGRPRPTRAPRGV
jgi:hypothetical protein